ncbi:MAG: transglycosylase domain-containing protein, partial [Egibacteraceae bacterium]
PSAYDPRSNPEAAQRRYGYVLSQMVNKGWLDPARAGRLTANPPMTRKAKAVAFKQAPYFLQMVKQELERELGPEEIYQGLVVTTTLDLDLQAKAEQAYDDAFVSSGIRPSGALVSVDNATGGIRALVGGKNYARSQLNLAQARRQPGSTFKPFALAAYVDEGKDPENYFDGPAEIEFTEAELEAQLGSDQPPGSWKPRNYEDAEYGELSLREATWKSVNTVYAQLVLEVGPGRAKQMARKAGIRSKMAAVPSIVLGTSGVNAVEMAEAYSTFATGGVRHQPHTLKEVRRDGEQLLAEDAEGERTLSEQVALTVTDVLRGVIDVGSGVAADIGRPAAGKTGTTQNNADAWFAGYTPQLTAVVWMGNVRNNKPMEGEYTGGSLPAETWQAFMSAAMEDLPVEDFPAAPGGLIITRPSPEPEPLQCPEGEVASEASDGTEVCVAVEPTEEVTSEATEVEPEPTEEPEPEPTQEPEPEPEPEPTEKKPEPPPDSTEEPTEPPDEKGPEPPPDKDKGGGEDTAEH